MIDTVLTREWGLRHPIVQAPMAGVAGGALAGAVTAAGGLGFLGVGSTAAPELLAREAALARPHGPFGIGLMIWALAQRPELLDLALAERPSVVALSFGDPGPYVARIQAGGARVVAQVQDGATAQRAARAGVDALVAQGREAGGHTGNVGLMPLLQLVLAHGDEAGIPVLAAGGIATGRGIAGALAMGCAGVWLGTRFAATVEALGAGAAKEAIVRADETQTIHTHVFDLIQGIPWPEEFPGRALRNDFTARWHGREEALVADLAAARQGFEAARSRGDYREAYIYAGEAVGLIRDLPAAGDVVTRLADEAEATLRRAAGLLG